MGLKIRRGAHPAVSRRLLPPPQAGENSFHLINDTDERHFGNPAQNEDYLAELSALLSPATVIRRDEPLAKHTTLRVGGPADCIFEPANENDLANLLKFCGAHDLKFFVLGRGSNLLVRDGGFRGVAIGLTRLDTN